MGQYKVPQNVEAEDKILGPFSMRQFIYVIIGVGYGFLMFAIFRKFIVGFVLLGVPPMLFMFLLGLGRRDDQSFEKYFIAVVSYYISPRVRLWEKEPLFEVFKIEVPPPKPEELRRDPREVAGQLERLAAIVDTRGWAIKQSEIQEADEGMIVNMQDRIAGETLEVAPALSAPVEVTAADDILATTDSEANNNLTVLMENSAKSVREEALAMMRKRAAATRPKLPVANAAILNAKKAALQPQSVPTTPQSSTSGMTAPISGDILKLATEGGDLSVAALAAQAAAAVQHNQELLEGQAVNIRNATITATPATS